MAKAPGRAASAVRLFDAHCHLQDPRIAAVAPTLIRAAAVSGVARFAVNGTSEIGLDKGSHGKTIDFGEQVEVFQRQLKLAKELEKPVSVHCVHAFGDLLEILKRTGPFPAGVLLHSYLGSAEMVLSLANLGCYFSLSGFLTGMKSTKAKQMLKAIPLDRILLETDAPDALPKLDNVSLVTVLVDSDSTSPAATSSNESLNHPANIHIVLSYVASLLEMPEAELAEVSYKNATKLFSYPGSKVHSEAETV
ncbi:hypothetical protein ACQ4PT_053949 [Festuca glaucescens]